MAVATTAFQWMDSLEKDFDVAFVDLDTMLGSGVLDQLEESESVPEGEEGELTVVTRQKLSVLSSCWAQLCHKAQTVFQNNAKLEAALVEARADLHEAEAARAVTERETRELLVQLHSAQLQLHKNHTTAATAAESENIIKKLDSDLYLRRRDLLREERLQSELRSLRSEVNQLNAYIVSLQSELVGCRLAAKYMDKELAGRIQQIQLLGRGLHGPEHTRLWTQLESEIRLHRHKTLIRACRSRTWRDRPPEPKLADVRVVHVQKADNEGLGMSITGGEEHGVPVIISALKPGGPAERSGLVYVGDTILSVNDVNLEQARHQEAVQLLSSVRGNIKLELRYLPTVEEDEGEGIYNMRAFRYDMMDGWSPPVPREKADTGTLLKAGGSPPLENTAAPAPAPAQTQQRPLANGNTRPGSAQKLHPVVRAETPLVNGSACGSEPAPVKSPPPEDPPPDTT